MTYSEFLAMLAPYEEKEFAAFQQKIIMPKTKILGVRTPEMRRIAREFRKNPEALLSFPDEYYEVTFIKLAAVSLLPYEKFCRLVGRCLPLIDNWALCDSFKADCLKRHKQDFLPYLSDLFATGKEFYQRYVLVTLLGFYTEKTYLPVIKEYLSRADTEKYYVHMAAAWLEAEVLVKYYDYGVHILQSGILPPKTHDKAIQKARESFRLTKEQKGFLQSLKIKKRNG